MSPQKKSEIGDPLALAALTGKIGGKPKSSSSDTQTSDSSEVQQSKPLEAQKSKNSDVEQSELSKSQTARLSDLQIQEILNFQKSELSNVQHAGNSKLSKSEHERKQKTVYLPAELARWLNIQAATEEREISDIVTDALEHYRQEHP